MAISVTFNATNKGTMLWPAGQRISLGEIAGPASYPTGGFAADIPTDFGINVAYINNAQVTSDAGYTASFNGDFEKIIVYASAGVEVTNATVLGAVTFTVQLATSDTA